MTSFFTGIIATFSLSFAALANENAVAQPLKPLRGEFALHGETIIDPPLGEPQDTHMGFYIDGEAAKQLYNAMKVKPVPEACEKGSGVMEKVVGEMSCLKQPGGKRYSCTFAIDIANQKIKRETAC